MHVFNPVFYDEYNLMNYLDFAVMKTAKLYPEVLREEIYLLFYFCLLYTSDAADEL